MGPQSWSSSDMSLLLPILCPSETISGHKCDTRVTFFLKKGVKDPILLRIPNLNPLNHESSSQSCDIRKSICLSLKPVIPPLGDCQAHSDADTR